MPLRHLTNAFIRIHILHHAAIEPFYGKWMIDELANHGYKVTTGTLYPMLYDMEKTGLLVARDGEPQGRFRRYYSVTPEGREILSEAKKFVAELVRELGEGSP